MRNVRRRPVTIYRTFLVNKTLDETSICDDRGICISELQRKQSAVLLGPFRKSSKLATMLAMCLL